MKKYSIVIVENDEDEQVFMKEGFEATGFFDIKAILKNGDMLMEWLDDNKNNLPEIILSDLNMPGKNGYDIITETRNNSDFSHIPVIITSTSSTASIMEKCISLGAADYVVKPDTFIDYIPYVNRFYDIILEKQLVK